MAAAKIVFGQRIETLSDLLHMRAEADGAQLLYRFHAAGGEDSTLTYAELESRAVAFAVTLQRLASVGDRVLISLGTGVDYVAALFGCMYAGMIGVPAFPARPKRWSGRLRSIVADAGIAAVITHSKHVPALQAELGEWMPSGGSVVLTDSPQGDPHTWKPRELSADSIAYLQYTSGSTSDPKGVMVTHRNLFHNARLLNECFGHSRESHIVSWLPLYHDMGLVGAVIQPLVGGFPATLFSPHAFLQRPIRWLEAISRYRATSSGAPNFAYELCTREAYRREALNLDLSCWKAAGCGAEPIRAETLERFAEMFGPAGFDSRSFFPCYGLAEATLIVTGSKTVTGSTTSSGPSIRSFRTSGLSRGLAEEATPSEQTTRLVGCGAPLERVQIEIVNPQTHRPAEAGTVGEIWVAGPSVAAGYWNHPRETELKFQARLATGEGPYLRAGDLGFVHGGELYIVGRQKELIIIRGRNLYPQDIERTVKESHPAFDRGVGAAFGVEDAQVERLVIVHEVDWRNHSNGAQGVFSAVLQAVWEAHEVEPIAIVLTGPSGIPRTSSGKVQRVFCRQQFEAGGLPVVAQWRKPAAGIRSVASMPPPELVRLRGHASTDAVRRWLIANFAQSAGLDVSEIDPRSPFSQLGLDSLRSVQISHELEQVVGVSLSPTLFWDHPNIDALAKYLAVQLAEKVKINQPEV